MINTQDATGNEIVIGKSYGYSNDKNGFCTVTHGIATKSNEGKVTLKVFHKVRSLYNDVPEPQTISRSVSVKALKLFPLLETNKNNEKSK